ncbi:uncharacterized protein PRCAT00000728001 [Priceomyces carsonii]|uniref:uncharacterized protein n=1 Tax=Priceomyces carsonii TaxID=28549 RepID=UPI002ED95483|nr:unnamed protein product [Priceomyces carsonii]
MSGTKRSNTGALDEGTEDDSKRSKASTGKRKYHQKSRNGCSTCKKRRVKCDETKPVCNKCKHMNLTCGYVLNEDDRKKEDEEGNFVKKRKVSDASSPGSSSLEKSVPTTQQATPSITPSPNELGDKLNLGFSSIPSTLLQAGNLNNLNLSHLVNNLSGLGGNLNNLGNLASLTNLATLAQLPIDLSNLGLIIDSQIHKSVSSNLNGAYSGSANSTSNKSSHNNHNNINNQEHENIEGVRNVPPYPDAKHREDVRNGRVKINDSISSASSQLNNQSQFNNVLKDKSNDSVNNRRDTDAKQHGDTPTPNNSLPTISPNINTLAAGLTNNPLNNPMAGMESTNLNMLDLRLMFHYTTQVSKTITAAGISDTHVWSHDIPMLAFDYPFLMHSILAFSATHLSRTEKGLDQCVTCHRGDSLRLLREAVLDINSDNTDALVASAIILIMDSLANASFPLSTSPKSLPASAWIFHVKGAATILTAVWPLTETSRFYKFISVDLGDLGDIMGRRVNFSKSTGDEKERYYTDLECHDSDIADLFPVPIDSPYLITLAYLSKLHKERYKSDFLLRVFSFPALLDKEFLSLLMTGDVKSMRIMRSYYKLLRSFTTEMKDKVWFLEGVSQVLPVDVEEYAGGAGGMHMMLDFLGGGPAIVENDLDEEISKFDPTGSLTKGLVDTNNLPSDITSNLDVMQGDSGFMNIK